MAVLVIPTTPSVPSYTQRTTLDGREYQFEFRWNTRDSAWYFHIADEQGAHIRSAIKVVLDWPLLRRIVDERRPPGSIMAIDSSGTSTNPTLDDFGTRVKLYYLDAAELAAIEAS
jgi:hypothetical protein